MQAYILYAIKSQEEMFRLWLESTERETIRDRSRYRVEAQTVLCSSRPGPSLASLVNLDDKQKYREMW